MELVSILFNPTPSNKIGVGEPILALGQLRVVAEVILFHRAYLVVYQKALCKSDETSWANARVKLYSQVHFEST